MEFGKDEDGKRHGGQNNGSLKRATSSSLKLVNMLHCMMKITNVIHSRISRWGDNSGLSEWAQYNHMVLIEGGRSVRVRSKRCDTGNKRFK